MSEIDEKAPSVEDVEMKEEVVEDETVEEVVKEEPVESAPNDVSKKGASCSGCVIASAVFLVVLFLILALFGFLIYRGGTEKQDLGVEGSIEGFEDFVGKTGIKTDVEYTDMCFTCDPLIYTGEQEAVVVITNEDASSWVGTVNRDLYGLRDVQLNFTDDGVVLSSYVSYNGQDYPIYVSGDIERVGDKEIGVTVKELNVMRIDIPDNYRQMAEDWLEEIGNRKIDEVDGLTIKKLEINDGELVFEGTVPEEISYE